jgi:hypothetical protein
MQFGAFVAEAMKGLESDAGEIAIGGAKDLAAACAGAVRKVFSSIDESVAYSSALASLGAIPRAFILR